MATARFPARGKVVIARGSQSKGLGQWLARFQLAIGRVLVWGGFGLAVGAALGLVLGLVRANAAGFAPAVVEGALVGLGVGAFVGGHAPGRDRREHSEAGSPEDEQLYFN